MSFSSFLNKLQVMFNIFEEESEEITEPAKVRMLLKKVEHPQLQDAIGASNYSLNVLTISPHWSRRYWISSQRVGSQPPAQSG